MRVSALTLCKLGICVSLCIFGFGCGGFAPSSSSDGGPLIWAKERARSPDQRIAVLELRNLAMLSKGEIRYLSNLLRQAAGRLPQSKFLVMTNDSMEALLPPEVNLDECEGTCPIEIGRTIQAHWLLVGEVVKFGGELRVSLNLHNVKTGALADSAVVKGANPKSLEGPLQGTAVGLFSALDPSMTRVAERLKRGFVFEKFQYSALPEFKEAESGSSSEVKVSMPSAVSATQVKGVNFGSVDVEGLTLYDSAVKLDRDPSASPESKAARWKEVAKRVKSVRAQAKKRAFEWREFIAKRDRRAARARARRAKARERREAVIAKLQSLQADDARLEGRRRAQMSRDWKKLSKLLSLEVVSAEDKLNWVEAFVESYGAVQGLNPHVGKLRKWTRKMGDRFDDLVDEGEEEVARRARRKSEIEDKIAQVRAQEQRDEKEFRDHGHGGFSLLAGTTWVLSYGKMEYKLYFKANGQLRNEHPNDDTTDNDFWSQSDSTVTLRFNSDYVVYRGTMVRQNQMSGVATNVKGKSWAWKAWRAGSAGK